jgi:EAL domain-containing protein (putative c-di-GMP-specific phosphodiesterase class I)
VDIDDAMNEPGRQPPTRPSGGRGLDTARVLAERSLRTAFQPICDLASREPIGFEALARFPGSSDATPRDWFTEAAAIGLLQPLEILAVETAIGKLPLLPGDAFLSLNVSPSTAATTAFSQVLLAVPPARLVLDISEHAVVEHFQQFAMAIDDLRETGVRIALDDAGATDVSLQHLLDIRPDFLKVDTTVIHGIGDDVLRQAVVSAYVTLAQRSGALILAEGIETEEELSALVSLGIGAGQGYLLGRPVFIGD